MTGVQTCALPISDTTPVANTPSERRWKSRLDMAHYVPYMVAVAQLVEHQFVVLRVAGSKPVGHPTER